MKYPMLDNFLIIKRKDEYSYKIVNYLTKDEYTISRRMMAFAHRLDGKTDPYTISEKYTKQEVDSMLKSLDNVGLLRHSRVLDKYFGSISYSVIIPHKTKYGGIICFFLNFLLLFSFLPVLALGIYRFVTFDFNLSDNYMLTGTIIGIFAGLILHEAGHAVAARGCGGVVYELGIMIQFFLPGGYTIYNADNVKIRFFRMQALAAGIEANFLIAGLALIFCTMNDELSGMFLTMALNNIFIALVNLSFMDGLDGSHLLKEFFDNPEIITEANAVVFNKKARNAIRAIGINGEAYVAVCFILKAFQYIGLLLIVMGIGDIIICFT